MSLQPDRVDRRAAIDQGAGDRKERFAPRRKAGAREFDIVFVKNKAGGRIGGRGGAKSDRNVIGAERSAPDEWAQIVIGDRPIPGLPRSQRPRSR